MIFFYVLIFAVGLLAGWLQCHVWRITIEQKGKISFLGLSIKLLFWGVSMVLLALWSIPLLLTFIGGSSAFMIGTAIRMGRHAGKEE